MARAIGTAPAKRAMAAAIVLVALGALGAVQASRAGASFMFDLEQVQPALSRVEPVVDDPHTPRLARRVFLVIVDGLRLDASYELPFLDELRRRGVDADATSHYPSWSRPNYVSILTGVPPRASGVRTNHHSTPVQLDSLMDRARGAGLRAAFASDYGLIPSLFLRPAHVIGAARLDARTAAAASQAALAVDDDALDDLADPFVDEEAAAPIAAIDIDSMTYPVAKGHVHEPDADLVSPFEDARFAPWPGGFVETGAALAARDDELVVLLVGAVDAAGHAHGAASTEYRAAAESVDRALARTLGRVDLARDAIIITADHGHTARGGHGGTEPEVLAVPLIAAGAGIVAGADPLDARLVDVAPTVAALLGVPAPGHGLGRTLTELVQLSPEERGRREAADRARLAETASIVAAVEGRAARDLRSHRALRISIVAAGALVAAVLAWGLVRRRVMRLDLRVVVVAVPGFFVVYYALIAVFGERFSPSLVPADGTLAGALAKYGIAATVVQLAASLWALRRQGSLADRLAAANGNAWVGLVLAMVPAGLLWAFFPPPYTIVPGPAWLVLIPAVEVSVACIATNIALTLVVEVIVFAARASGARSGSARRSTRGRARSRTAPRTRGRTRASAGSAPARRRAPSRSPRSR